MIGASTRSTTSLDVQLIDKAAPKIDENNWDDMKRKWVWFRFQIYYKDGQSGSNVMSMFNVEVKCCWLLSRDGHYRLARVQTSQSQNDQV